MCGVGIAAPPDRGLRPSNTVTLTLELSALDVRPDAQGRIAIPVGNLLRGEAKVEEL